MSDEEEKPKPSKRPTNIQIRGLVRKIIPTIDIQNTGVKQFTRLLSKELGGVDLKSRLPYIKQCLTEAMEEMDGSSSEDEDDAAEEDEEEDDDAEEQALSKPKKKKGLELKREISKELAELLQRGNQMARTDVVKYLWEYIKENGLQNPNNKREIFLDEKMQKVFGCEQFTMFTMNKYLGAHIHPFKEVDLTAKSKSPKKKPTTRKRKATEKDGKPVKQKRARKKPGLQPPYQLSSELASLVGYDILPRPQVVTALWKYIKDKDLQNPDDKREIICDDKLKTIMGGEERVTMFNMNRYITGHLVKKLDRSMYDHEKHEAELAANEGEEDDEEEEEEEEEEEIEESESEEE